MSEYEAHELTDRLDRLEASLRRIETRLNQTIEASNINHADFLNVRKAVVKLVAAWNAEVDSIQE